MSLAVAIPILISSAALALSIFTLWLTYLRRGKLQMTRPTLLFMCREGPRNEPKFFLRALLFTTGQRGWVIERLFLRLRHKAGSFVFDTWGYGPTNELSPGSGLFVGHQGVVFNHHFLPRPQTADDFLFWDGDYRVEVFAVLFGRKAPHKLSEFKFTLRGEHAAEMVQIPNTAVYLEWDIDSGQYVGRTEKRR